VQVEPIKPVLKAPGTKCLKLKCDEPLSSFDFNFNLRHYTVVDCVDGSRAAGLALCTAFAAHDGLASAAAAAGFPGLPELPGGWSWGGDTTLAPLVSFLMQTDEAGQHAGAAAAAPLLAALSQDARVHLIAASAGAALISALRVQQMSPDMGRGVLVEPMIPMLKAPDIERLKP
jgi:hypothetical protein